MKKILSIVLCAALLLSSLSFALADEEATPTEIQQAVAADYVIRDEATGKVLSVNADGTGFTFGEYIEGRRSTLWHLTLGEETTIYSRINNRAITNGDGVTLEANKTTDQQLWTVSPEGSVRAKNGQYLAISEDEELIASAEPFIWSIVTEEEILADKTTVSESGVETVVGGTMVMLLEGTNLVLASDADNVTITAAPYKMGDNSQLWNFTKNGDAYNISSAVSKKLIDVSGNNLNAGGQLILWKETGGENQKWIVEQENGICYIKSKFSGHYLSNTDGRTAQLAKADASKWKLMNLDEMNSVYLAGTGNSQAFEKDCRVLENLGIISADKVYYEKNTVTNADAVKCVVKLLTGGAEIGGALTEFEDLAAEDEVSGYAAMAVTMNLIEQKTKFYADYAANADEYLEALLRGMGYAPLAKTSGGYMAVANNKKFLRGVGALEDNALTYGQFFRILTNALSIDVFSKGGDVVLDETTLINSRWSIEVLKKAEITYADESKGVFTAEADGEAYELRIPENYKLTELKGLRADIWIDTNADEVVNIDFYAGTNVAYGYITEANGVEEADALFNPNLITSFKINGEKTRFNVANNAVVTYNDLASFGGSKKIIGSFVRLVQRGGKVTHMDIYELSEGGLFRETDGESITLQSGEKSNFKIKNYNEKAKVKVVLNGKLSRVDSLPYNALADYCETDDFLLIAANVNIVSGIFSGLDYEGFSIDEDVYRTDNFYGKVYYSYDMGKTYEADSSKRYAYNNNPVAVYLDGCQRVRYIRGENNTDSIIGVITDINVGLFDRVKSVTVFAEFNGTNSTRTYEIKLSKSSDISEKDLVKLKKESNTDNSVYEFRMSGNKINRIMELDWLVCSDNSKDQVSATVRGNLVEDYGEERVNDLFADKNIFITGWTMGRDYGLTRIHFNATTDSGADYTLVCGGFNTRYVMAYDSDEDFRPREINWYDYRNTNFDRSFLKVGFLKENTERISPDIVFILSSNKYVSVSSWDVHGIVKRVIGKTDDSCVIELLEPNNYVGEYIIEKPEDMYGYYDNVCPKKGDVVTLTVRGNYEKIYYNQYGEEIDEEEAWELEDKGDYVELREEYRTNGYANVAKTWDMPNEIGRFNNDYSVTYVDDIYKIDGNLMYYKDADSAVRAYSSAGGNMFIIEDASKYLMFDYEDCKRGYFGSPLTLDDISVRQQGGESDKLLILSVSRGRYPKVILRMSADWEP